ncbi:MAG: hypothetical protein AB2556_24490, partial [Candidatus Thiodiazotropha sp.]
AVFSTWRVEGAGGIGDAEVADGIYERAGRLALHASMTDERAAKILARLPGDDFLLKLLRREQQGGDWVVEDKFDPVRTEREKGQAIVEVSRDTKPGVLTGIDKVYYPNPYPVTAVV